MGVLSSEATTDRKRWSIWWLLFPRQNRGALGVNRGLVSAEVSVILTTRDVCQGGMTTTYTRGKHVASER